MKPNRPVNLDLTTIKFPPMAIVSILHRVSGVIVFLFIPLLLWMFQASLESATSFSQLRDLLATPLFTLLIWATLAGLIFHLLAGIRHLLMDLHITESLEAGRRSAIAVIILSIIVFILVGVLIW